MIRGTAPIMNPKNPERMQMVDWDAELDEIAKTAVNIMDCERICDYIVKGELTLPQAMRAYSLASHHDRYHEDHAAHIRDTIRDNFEEATI